MKAREAIEVIETVRPAYPCFMREAIDRAITALRKDDERLRQSQKPRSLRRKGVAASDS